jgi:hypothetical protein
MSRRSRARHTQRARDFRDALIIEGAETSRWPAGALLDFLMARLEAVEASGGDPGVLQQMSPDRLLRPLGIVTAADLTDFVDHVSGDAGAIALTAALGADA